MRQEKKMQYKIGQDKTSLHDNTIQYKLIRNKTIQPQTRTYKTIQDKKHKTIQHKLREDTTTQDQHKTN